MPNITPPRATSPTTPSDPPTTDSTPTTPSSTFSGPFSHRDSISTTSSSPLFDEDEHHHQNTKIPSFTVTTTEIQLPSPILSLLTTTAPASPTTTKLVDPLSQTFPKPNCTATIDEMLARTPGKWSLNHYVKHGKYAQGPVVDTEARARQFAETKAELLQSKRDLDMDSEARDLEWRRWG